MHRHFQIASEDLVEAPATFTDVPTSHWAFKYVECAVANGIVGGYGGGLYRPDQNVDRGQMAVFVARSMVYPPGDAVLAYYEPPITAILSRTERVAPGGPMHAPNAYSVGMMKLTRSPRLSGCCR